MGMVLGKTNVAEPAFEILYQNTPVKHLGSSSSSIAYEIRKYGERFAAETSMKQSNGNNDEQPFRLLANYIGVFGKPENEGQKEIAMTAPVMKKDDKEGSGQAIAMTAPVMRGSNMNGTNDNEKTMMFVLPAEYTSIDSIPKPTNPAVHIIEIPPAIGAVYQYSGSMDEDVAKNNAIQLANQLRTDFGFSELTNEYAIQNYQFWGYCPPFTIPVFRRNEVWIQLNDEQVNRILNKDNISTNVN